MATDKAETRKEMLSGKEVLTGVYQGLVVKYAGTETIFTTPIKSEVAHDGDDHGWGSNRTGYTLFDKASVITINEQKWVLALATKIEGYAAYNVSGELKAFKVDDIDINTLLRALIIRRTYYEDAALVAMAEGELVTDKSVFQLTRPRDVFNSVAENVRSEIKSLTHKKHPYTYETGIQRIVRYSPEVTELVTSKVVETLTNLSQ